MIAEHTVFRRIILSDQHFQFAIMCKDGGFYFDSDDVGATFKKDHRVKEMYIPILKIIGNFSRSNVQDVIELIKKPYPEFFI